MIRNWLFNPKDDLLVASLTDKIERKLPPTVAKSRSKSLNVERVGDIFEEILGEALRFKRSESPNFFRKARIANMLKWSLKNAGYSDEFCDTLSRSLIIYMAKK